MSENLQAAAAPSLPPEPLGTDQEAALRQNFALVKQIIAEHQFVISQLHNYIHS
jgi:hypothetical protein